MMHRDRQVKTNMQAWMDPSYVRQGASADVKNRLRLLYLTGFQLSADSAVIEGKSGDVQSEKVISWVVN